MDTRVSWAIAYAFTGLLRAASLPCGAAQAYLPRDMVAAEGFTREDMFAGRGGESSSA